MTWDVIHGDCLDVLRGMSDASVDAVVTDPPYSSGGTFRGDRVNGGNSEKYGSVFGQHHQQFAGDTRDQRSFGYWVTLWMSECLRLTRPGGVACVFTDWRQLPTVTDVFQAAGWVWRGIVVWDKTAAMRPQAGRFKQQAEFVVWGSNGPMPMNYSDPCHDGVFSARAGGGERFHIAQKPVALLAKLVCIVPAGGLVLDPFAGSGTTGVACVETGRSFIGIEREAAYVEIARRRIAHAQSAQMAP